MHLPTAPGAVNGFQASASMAFDRDRGPPEAQKMRVGWTAGFKLLKSLISRMHALFRGDENQGLSRGSDVPLAVLWALRLFHGLFFARNSGRSRSFWVKRLASAQ